MGRLISNWMEKNDAIKVNKIYENEQRWWSILKKNGDKSAKLHINLAAT